jgi:hypothetical protein
MYGALFILQKATSACVDILVVQDSQQTFIPNRSQSEEEGALPPNLKQISKIQRNSQQSRYLSVRFTPSQHFLTK